MIMIIRNIPFKIKQWMNSVIRKKKNSCMTITSTNSWVNLNADVSKPRFFPGEIDKIKPKSMWIRWPSASSKMFPLCLNTMYSNILCILMTRSWKHATFCQKQSTCKIPKIVSLETYCQATQSHDTHQLMLALAQQRAIYNSILSDINTPLNDLQLRIRGLLVYLYRS